MVTMSPKAKNKLQSLIAEKNKPEHGLRIYIQAGGCSGMSYKMEFDDNIQKSDEVIDQNGVHLIVDKFSLRYLDGAEIDYADEGLMGGSFVVNNPNAKTTCGCGQSFKA